MNHTRLIAFLILVAIIVIGGLATLFSTAYRIDEGKQAIILQFGRPVGDAVTEPGLHFKTPFIQKVRRFEKRILAWDGDPNQIPTKGREFISVDTTARWRIVNPLQFYTSVGNEAGAQSRLDDVIDSVVRDNISSTELVDIVRSADWEMTEEKLQKIKEMKPEEKQEVLTKEVKTGRKKLTRNILQEAGEKTLEKYGIKVEDVRIKRINYIPSVRKQVYNRMISERNRIAEQYRSEGKGRAAQIRGETSRQLAGIRSDAKRKAEIIRGEADGKATEIYNEAYSESPGFYAFYRTLESYKQSLDKDTVLMVGSESDYFKFLRDIDASMPSPNNSQSK